MARTVRMGVAFDGEKEVKSAVSNINAHLKSLKSEAQAVKSAFEGQEKSEAALKATSDVLARTLEKQKSKLETLATAVRKAEQHEEALQKRQRELPGLIEEETQKLDEMKRSMNSSADAIEKQERLVNRLEKELKDMPETQKRANTQTEKWKDTLHRATAEMNRTQRELDQTEDALDHVGDEARDSANDLEKLDKASSGVGGKISAMSVAFGNFMSNIAMDAIRNAAAAVRQFTTNVIELGKNFDSSMSNVKALSGATEAEFVQLEQTARAAGKSTIFSASESADALSYMALAGWNTEQMVAGLPAVLDLAAAAQMDLAEASDIVTDNVTAFGLSVEDSAHLADVMAYAMSHSNTDVTQLGEAYKNVAATAASLGFTVEDTTAVLMTMANAGVKGGEAGTALNAVMTRLATNTSNATDMLQELGIKVYDSNGNMVALSEILEGLSKEWTTLTGEEQANLSKIIAGQHHYAAFNTIMQGVSDEAKKGGQSFQDYTKALKTCDGAAKEMSATMNDNLEGDLKTLRSVWEDFQLTLYKTESGAMRKIVQTISGSLIPALEALVTGSENARDMLATAFSDIVDNIGDIGGDLIGSLFGDSAGDAFKDLFDEISEAIEDIFALFDDIGPIIADLISQGAEAIQMLLPPILDIIQTLLPFVQKIVEVLGKAAHSILPILQTCLEAINAILGPIIDALSPLLDLLGAIFDVIGWVVDGLKWFFSGCPVVAENFEEVSDAAKELNKSLESQVRSWNSMMQAQEKAFAKSDVEINNIQDMVDELDKLVDSNGKVKKGYEARATYLTGELSAATGIEIECINGVVKHYGKLKQSIEDVMAAKRAEALQNYYQAILDSFEGGVAQLSHHAAETKTKLAALEQAMSETTDTDKWNELNEEYQQMKTSLEDMKGQMEVAAVAEARLEETTDAMVKGNIDKINELYKSKEVVYFEDGVAHKASIDDQIEADEAYLEWIEEYNDTLEKSGDETLKRVVKDHQEASAQKLSNQKDEKNKALRIETEKFAQMRIDTSTTMGQVMGILQNGARNGMQSYSSEISNGSGKAKSALEGVIADMKTVGLSASLASVGDNLMSTLASSIYGGLDKAVSAMEYAMNEVNKKAKKVPEISSPSKVFRRIGEFLMQGLTEGIKSTEILPTMQVEHTMRDVVDTAQTTVTMIPSLSAMSMFDNVSTQNNGLLQAISRLENKMEPKSANIYNINGITYDDGSNVSGAVRDLIHAAKIERRV